MTKGVEFIRNFIHLNKASNELKLRNTSTDTNTSTNTAGRDQHAYYSTFSLANPIKGASKKELGDDTTYNVNMASKLNSVVHKLHAVTLIKSAIGQPWWEKRTVKFLGLNKLHKTVIVKNTATMNGQLQAIKHLIDVKPIEVVEGNTSSRGEDGVFLRENGQFLLSKFDEYLKNNPPIEKVIRARRKQVVWETKRRR